MEEPQAIDFLSTLIPFIVVVFIIAMGVILLTQQFRKNLLKQQLEQEELKAGYQRDLLQISIQVQEDERKRIAQDLHDELGAALSISRMRLKQLEGIADKNQVSAQESIESIRETIENALATTRRISHELMPVQLANLGWIRAVQSLLDKAQEAGNWKVDFVCNQQIEEEEWQVKIGLYRICAELINNSLKHANASDVRMELKVDDRNIVFNYQDNGEGLSEEQLIKGVGLRSLEGRVIALNGSSQFIESHEGGFGWCLRIPKN